MRILLVVLGVAAAVSAQGPQAKFTTKFKNIVTDYLGTNTDKALNMVSADVLAGKDMDAIVKNIMDNVLTLVPSNKYLPALSMLTGFDSCMKKAGSSVEKGMASIGFAFNKHLQPLFKKVTAKVKAMQANKKKEQEIKNQAFTIATAALTKPLVQQIINTSMAKSNEAEYNCALGPLKTILKTANYNIAYKASG